MSLSAGDKLGPYEILAPIGVGGMGEVYRARDTKLKREVAIKVVPEAFARDPERMARFQREAEVLASLSHPNIAAIYGLEERALVMELVEGESPKGPVPFDEAWRIASQIAAALEYAHDKGIIHRDLKPANVKVTPEGVVKLLDFGLAKTFTNRREAPAASAENSPTLTMGATEVGMILGTAAYMSPEQARGKQVDKRADIWSFGVVFYELLTGIRMFQGEDAAETLAAVIHKQPDLSAAPERVRRLLAKCLEKDPSKRLRDMSSVRLLLEDADAAASMSQSEALAPKPLPAGPVLPRWAWGVMGVFGALAILAGFFALRGGPAARGPVTAVAANLTMEIAPAEALGFANFYNRPSRTAMAISPDGATVVFVGQTGQDAATRKQMLYHRALSNPAVTAIAGTEGAEYPFFSPDGEWVGFAAGNKLKKVALSGGPPIDVCEFPLEGRIEGATWGSAGTIVFARGGLWTVAASGGKAEILLAKPQPTSFYAPAMLPDGHTVLFTEVGPVKWEEAHVDAVDVKTKQRKMLLSNAADARYSATGHVVFVRDASLLAVAFDAQAVAVKGAPVPLLAGVMQATNAPNVNDETGMGQYALSASGTLVYASGGRYPTNSSTLVRVDRKGNETKIAEIRGSLFGVRVSPDGARAIAFKTREGSRASDLWVFELSSGSSSRLTSAANAAFPVFAADGKSIFFIEAGESGAYSLALNGNATPQRAMQSNDTSFVSDMTADGKWFVYLQTVGSARQIFVVPVQDGKLDAGQARQFSPSMFTQLDGRVSPDGKWMAYRSDESGTNEVYVQAFPDGGGKRRVSVKGGSNPVWARNGRELFYLTSNGASETAAYRGSLMAVDVRGTAGEARLSEPRALFEGNYTTSSPAASYDVTPDGQFVMVRPGEPPDERVTKLNVVLGWGEELKRHVPR